ncbi:SDR family oxidoreductase [Corynebacterium sp. 3HC-13]|uniref:SDR family oxidoreductase n=1 Tax=Corynebacterium poyangense TaxID=2684405 RepID=UPI001CCD1AA5|nr:SDR family oxidoreductase [Corynebacterium poyangense]MBZ8177222.1 SDR family oxidoreductase [Corynebacterium poyangense]
MSSVAVVTGASGGVGAIITQELLAKGWEVYPQYRREAARHEVEERLSGAHWWQADFLRPPAEALANLPVLDTVDAVIHCAGVCPLGELWRVDQGTWQETMQLNVIAPALLTGRLIEQLRAAQGHVIYLNSGAGQHTRPEWGCYSASKFAARAWCDGLRAEEEKLRVTSIYPGRIATQMQREVVASLEETWQPEKYLRPESVAAAVIAALESTPDAHPTEITLRPR